MFGLRQSVGFGCKAGLNDEIADPPAVVTENSAETGQGVTAGDGGEGGMASRFGKL